MLATMSLSIALMTAPVPPSHQIDNLGKITDLAPKTRTIKVHKPSDHASSAKSDDLSSDAYKDMDPYEAKIVYLESRGDEHATNGRYYGLFQLDLSYLKGDLSRENQFKVAKQYLKDRYNNSWKTAYEFHIANNWW